MRVERKKEGENVKSGPSNFMGFKGMQGGRNALSKDGMPRVPKGKSSFTGFDLLGTLNDEDIGLDQITEVEE